MKTVNYRIHHQTTYSYESSVGVCHNLVMLTPRQSMHVRNIKHRVIIKPHPIVLNRREDYYGNHVHAFSIEENHRQLVVTAAGHLQVSWEQNLQGAQSPTWEEIRQRIMDRSDPRWLEACQFQYASRRIKLSPDFAAYARKSFTEGRPVLEAAIELTERIFADFKYDSQATHVNTPTDEAFKLRRGVCQDFAHIQIACLRSIGLPAQYVSGYLRTHPPEGQPKLIGADQSHAWVAAYCGPQFGWIDLDPTNHRLCDHDHIPIARGRDYDDVVPIRGVFLGGGKHQINVSVTVEEINES